MLPVAGSFLNNFYSEKKFISDWFDELAAEKSQTAAIRIEVAQRAEYKQ